MTVTRPGVLMLISAACFLIAALTVAFGLDIGPALAWAFGGFSAWALSGSGL